MYHMEESRIAYLIERIGNLLRSEERVSGADSGLQSVHVQILTYLSKCNRYSNTPAGVTEFIGSTKGTISQSINILEKKGFITKRPDEKDRRILHLILTVKGQSFIDSEFPSSKFNDAIESLDSSDAESLSQLLTKLLIKFQQNNNGKLFGVCHTCKHFKKFGLGETHQCGLTLEPLSEKESLQICREYEEPQKKAV